MHKNNITKIIDCKGITVEDIKINNNEEYVHIYAKVDKPKNAHIVDQKTYGYTTTESKK